MEDELSKAEIHVRVWGRVQGVGFRAFVREQANLFRVTGWVRNVGRDQVEMCAEGMRESLDNFLAQVKKGPRVSKIRESKVEWREFNGRFEKFGVRWF